MSKFREGDWVDLVSPGLSTQRPFGRVIHFGGRNGLEIRVQYGDRWDESASYREHELKPARHLRLVKD